jgi:hypothetical protein
MSFTNARNSFNHAAFATKELEAMQNLAKGLEELTKAISLDLQDLRIEIQQIKGEIKS